MSDSVDLLVVGGGPAGATLGALAADAGLRTVVVERARYPRDKVCGEFLSAEGCRVLERLDVLDDLLAAGASWLGSCRMTHPRGPVLDLALPAMGSNGREALGVSRRLLDSVLVARAAAAGATVLQPWEATAPVIDERRVRGFHVREIGNGRTREIRAKLVVAADGRRSRLARAFESDLEERSAPPSRSWFGLSAHFDPRGRHPERRIELHLFDGGYAGVGPVEDGTLNLGLIVSVATLRACDGSPDRLLAERLMTNPSLRETLGAARRCRAWKGIGPLRFGPRRATAGGALFVGDAAGTLDPFCGEGMANALCGAELALPFVRGSTSHGSLSDDMARNYEAAWREAFLPVTRRVRLLGRLLQRQRLARPVLQLLAGAGNGIAPRLMAATRTDWSA